MADRRARDRTESGVVAVVVALVTCFVMIPVAAIAVDLGVQRVARRDVQAVADVVALDLARQLDGRTWAQLHGHLPQWAARSAEHNRSGVGDVTVSAELGTVDPGRYDPADPDAYFTPVTSDLDGIPTAIRVTAVGAVDFSIHGGSGGVVRTAIARSQSSACFQLGSFALNLDSASSPLLDALLGDALGVSAVSYTGLADANVTLLGLATELGAGTTDDLLALDDLSLGDLYLAGAHALAKQGGDSADVTLLEHLASLGVGSLPHLAFGDLIALQPGDEAALGTTVNLLDLVATSAFIANGTHALAVPDLTASLPGLGAVTGSLQIIEGPQLACGSVGVAQAHTAQVTLHLTVAINPANLFTIPLLGLLTAQGQIDVDVDLASATGTLRMVQCAPGQPDGVDVEVASALSQLGASLPMTVKLAGIPIVSLSGGVGTTAPPSTGIAHIRVPPGTYDTPVSTGTGTLLPGLTVDDLHATVLGVIDLGPVTSAIQSVVLAPIVNPLLSTLDTGLLTPLADLLGIRIAGADVFLDGPPTCGLSSLAG